MPISSPEEPSRSTSTSSALCREARLRDHQASSASRISCISTSTPVGIVRYRSATNPDFGATFPQAITLKNVTAIPRNNTDFNGAPNPNFPGNEHIQAIANVAGFHFGYIEQGGSSLYAAMSQKVTDPEVLEITLGIGGDEIAHFLEWVDFAGNGVQQPVAPFTDSISGLTFPDFFNNPPLQPPSLVQPSLIFPVPCEFISPNLPHVSIIRPLTDKFAGAVATIASFTADGLFIGQSQAVPQNTANDGRRSGCSRPLCVTFALQSLLHQKSWPLLVQEGPDKNLVTCV